MNIFILIVKPILIFLIGYLFVRLMKKHSMATSTPFDFLITVVLGNILAQPIVSNQLDMAFLYAAEFIMMQIIFSKLVLWRSVRPKLAFKPTILVNKGKMDESALSRERMAIPHFLAELRVKGYPNIADIEFAILEETGDISVIPKDDKRPLQPADLGLKTPYTGLPTTLIVDGQIVEAHLHSLGKNRSWLMSLLELYGIRMDSLSYISLASLDGTGKLHVDYFSNNKT